MNALGIHVFAGGFTRGVQDVFDVKRQLEIHDLGAETATKRLGVEVVRCDSPEDWPAPGNDVVLAYGNPRCTGFSCITAGHDTDLHGPWAKQTRDIHDFCEYVIKHDIPFAVWESVTQAYSTGRELLDYLRDELFVPHGYRICHVLIGGQAFGNSQRRQRYFFVAHKKDYKFNVAAPELPDYITPIYDVISPWEDEEVNVRKLASAYAEYDDNSVIELNPSELACLPYLDFGWCVNILGKFKPELLPEHFADIWKYRRSEMPFSMHCVRRLGYWAVCPTMHSGCGRFIHPIKHRPLTVKEISALMGWDFTPLGPKPHFQIAKGVIPAIGTWLAQQVQYALNGDWGDDDFYSTYNNKTNTFEGESVNAPDEKTFNLKHYVPGKLEWPRDEYDPIKHRLRFPEFSRHVRRGVV